MPLLTLQSPILYEYAPRQYTLNVVSLNPITFQGDVQSIFNSRLDSMYLFKNSVNTWAFRTNGTVYNGTNTSLFMPQFAYSTPTTLGTALITECYHEVKPVYGRTLCMIGDSITWHTYGSYFRSYLRDKGLEYDFAGTHIDTFNFRHEGEGGNTSFDVVNRINKIAKSTHYFILLGTNDIYYPNTQQTIDNLKTICANLLKRSPCKIFLSTLLPRTDNPTWAQRANDVNSLLRATTFETGIKLIDLNNELISYLPMWSSYTTEGLHPNLALYDIIATKLTPLLEF